MAIQTIASKEEKGQRHVYVDLEQPIEAAEKKLVKGFHLWQMGWDIDEELIGQELPLGEFELDLSSQVQQAVMLMSLKLIEIVEESGCDYFFEDLFEASEKGVLFTDTSSFMGMGRGLYSLDWQKITTEEYQEEFKEKEDYVFVTACDLDDCLIDGVTEKEYLASNFPHVKVLDIKDIFFRLQPDLGTKKWASVLEAGAIQKYSDGSFTLPGYGIELVVKEEDSKLKLVNPEFTPRENAYFISNVKAVVDPGNVWGQMLFEACLTGATRNYVGALLRRDSTNLVVPSTCYGNKSTYNEKVENSKHGVLDFVPTFGVGHGIRNRYENSNDPYAVHQLYEFLINEGIPSFPQHQGNDVRSGMAALSSEVSLIEYKGVKIFLFGRAIDKITKVFNRCSLLNRVGVEGAIHNNLEDR